MRAGKARHEVLAAWVEAGCPPEYPGALTPSLRKTLSPPSKLPVVRPADIPSIPAMTEVYFWLDPVMERAGVVCTGRRPTAVEYPEGEHIITAGTDVVGLVSGGLTVIDWESRSRTVWQLKHAMLSAWLLSGRPGMISGIEIFHPSGYQDAMLMTDDACSRALRELAGSVKTWLAQRAGYPLYFSSGPHCRYCRAFEACPMKEDAAQWRPGAKKP